MIEEAQAAELERAARTLADYVDATSRTARVFGVTPPVRKIMHTALNEDERVQNSSEGGGIFRHILLRPPARQAEPRGEQAQAPVEQTEAPVEQAEDAATRSDAGHEEQGE